MKEVETNPDRSPAWPASLDASRTQSVTNSLLPAVRFVCLPCTPQSLCLLRPMTSSPRIQASIESKSLARFCGEFLNLLHLAKSTFSKSVVQIETRMRQDYSPSEVVESLGPDSP
jgi:hypothetical protein